MCSENLLYTLLVRVFLKPMLKKISDRNFNLVQYIMQTKMYRVHHINSTRSTPTYVRLYTPWNRFLLCFRLCMVHQSGVNTVLHKCNYMILMYEIEATMIRNNFIFACVGVFSLCTIYLNSFNDCDYFLLWHTDFLNK